MATDPQRRATPSGSGVRMVDVDTDLSGLDALEVAAAAERKPAARAWSAVWPKLAALAITLLVWQVIVWSGIKPEYSLPGPVAVLERLVGSLGTGDFWRGIEITMRRAVVGFAAATVIGLLLGVATARLKPLRVAIGSMITGLQTMPSIAWFPLAILLFQISEQAIAFVIILGAAPSIANGVINGVDYVPPLLLRVGRNLGAQGLSLYRHVILPASLPSIVAGLKQGWAFAWRSLMAGELLVIIASAPSLGVQLSTARDLNDAPGLMSTMIVIFVIGIVVDVAFSSATNAIRRRWGIIDG